jgi:glycine hydroxymethyltransferase
MFIEAAQVLAENLIKLGYELSGGRTDTHLILIDLRPNSIEANRVEKVLEMVHIYCNRNSVADDKPGVCSGIRFGTGPMIVRGMPVHQFGHVADLIHEAISITKRVRQDAISMAEKT